MNDVNRFCPYRNIIYTSFVSYQQLLHLVYENYM